MQTIPRRQTVPMRTILAQLLSIWFLGIVAAFSGLTLLLIAVFLGIWIFAIPTVVLVFVGVYLIGLATPQASVLSAGHWIRLLWTAIITVVGIVGGVFASSMADVLGIDTWMLFLPLLGLPLMLITGALTRRLSIQLGSIALLVTFFVLCFTLPGVWHSFSSFWDNLLHPGGMLRQQ